MLDSVVVSLVVLQMALTDCFGVLISVIIVKQVLHTCMYLDAFKSR